MVLGVRKIGRPTKSETEQIQLYKSKLESLKMRYRGLDFNSNKQHKRLSNYILAKMAKFTPLEVNVALVNVLDSMSVEMRNYLESGMPLLNVSSIPGFKGAKPQESKTMKSDKIEGFPVEKFDLVWAKHRNGRFYKAKVTEIKKMPLFCVYFPADQSFSRDVHLEDLVGWRSPEMPTRGQRLRVKWCDGDIYEADYLGKLDCTIYTVEFEDESFLELKRDAIFAMNEAIPRRFASKLSYASDMKNREHLYDLERKLPNKRPVKKKTFQDE